MLKRIAVLMCAAVMASPVRVSDFFPLMFNAKERYEKKMLDDEVIYGNIFVSGVNVGGMAREDAVKVLSEVFLEELKRTEIAFTDGETRIVYNLAELGAFYDANRAAEEAYAYGRTGLFRERSRKVSHLSGNPLEIVLPYGYSPAAAEKAVDTLAEAFDKKPVEPVLTRSGGVFRVIGGANGREVVKEDLKAKIIKFLEDKNGGTAVLSFTVTEPEYTPARLYEATKLIGSYSTEIRAGDANRTQNVELAAGRINNKIVMPGEVFSASKSFGANAGDTGGYKPAGTYVQGRVIDTVGGGICQVASTLYMALLYAELNIVERLNHSMGVGYMDYAFDAAVAGDYMDLKFKNDTGLPVTIETHIDGTTLLINVYGRENRPETRTIMFENELLETIPPPDEQITYDPMLPKDCRVVDVPEKEGFKYRLYKLVYIGGKLVDKVIVNTSTYKGTRGEVRIGR